MDTFLKKGPNGGTMKVDVTVIAEFPAGMSLDAIARLAEVNRHPAAIKKTTVAWGPSKVSGGRRPRRVVKWQTSAVDLRYTTPDEVFQARLRVAAKYGISLRRTIWRSEIDESANAERGQTVFWTWGEGDLMDLAPLPPV
jgi:hypothetical protein